MAKLELNKEETELILQAIIMMKNRMKDEYIKKYYKEKDIENTKKLNQKLIKFSIKYL